MQDIPTIARKRQRLNEICPSLVGDITMKEAIFVFGVLTKSPIVRLLEQGKISGDKATGEWCIDAASIDNYLTEINERYNRQFS